MEHSSTQKQNIQAVFLIDTRQFHVNRENKDFLDRAFRATGVSVLRLLTYLANKIDCDKTKFTWGYQFFKIPLNTHFYSRRSVFREFTGNIFRDFENQLQEEIYVDDIRTSSRRSKQKQTTGAEISPAFSLKYALHDASLEYRWDELVISSPVKSAYISRRKNVSTSLATNKQGQQQTKFVFVLLPCPVTLNQLEKFTEDKSRFDPSSLKRTFINIGKQESILFDHHGASLFWLDTRNLWQQGSTNSDDGGEIKNTVQSQEPIKDHDGYNLINRTLALVRGCVIPMGCLTNSNLSSAANIGQLIQRAGSPIITATQDLKEDSSLAATASLNPTANPDEKGSLTPGNLSQGTIADGDSSAIPAQSVTVAGASVPACDALLKQRPGVTTSNPHNLISPVLPYTALLNHCTQDRLSKSAAPSSLQSSSDLDVRLCSSTGEVATVRCILKLQLLWTCSQNSEPSSVPVSGQDRPSTHDILVTGTSREAVTIPIHLAVSGTSSTEAEPSHAPPDKSSSQAGVDLRGSILAAVPREALTLDLYQANEVYSCLGFDTPGADDRMEAPSTWFQQLLLQLSHKNHLLVIQLCGRIAVLEPLTPVLGSLRVIDSRRLLAVERVIAFQGMPLNDLGKTGDLSKEEANPGSQTIMKLNREMMKKRSGGGTGSSKSSQLRINLHRETRSMKPFSSSCFEPWYQNLPQRGVTAKFLEQLVSFPESLVMDDSVNLDSALSQLKSLYRSGRASPPAQERPVDAAKEEDKEVVKPEAKITKNEAKMMRSVTARTRSIVANSKKVETQTPQDSPKQKKIKKREATQVFVPDKDFSSLEDLQTYVSEAYNSAIQNGTNFLPPAQQIVFLTVHFMKEQKQRSTSDDVPGSVRQFLRDHLLRSNPDLVVKYQDPGLDRETRVKEAQLQALLRLEAEVAFPTEVKVGDKKVKGQAGSGQDDESDQSVFNSSLDDTGPELPEEVQEAVDEISQLLCSIPLLADHDQLLAFLHDVVLPSYSDTIPYMVKAVFEELGHPVPNELMSPTSSKPSVKPPLSYNSVRSWGSIDAPASSTRSQTLSRHPSLADASHKRIIPIPQPKRAKTKKLPLKKEEPETEAKRAKRNLFSDDTGSSGGGCKLTRRESIAVMEGISKPRRQSPRKHVRGPPRRSPRKHPQGPSRPSPRKNPQGPSRVLKTRKVKETPGKRQVSQAVLCNVNRARKLEARLVGKPLSPTIEVIEESPVKLLIASSAPRTFPRHLNKNLSFYSQDKLREARRMSARITGSSPEPGPDIVKKVKQMKSPARSFLKEVCTPSTLGSLSRLRSSGLVSLGDGGSPELMPAKRKYIVEDRGSVPKMEASLSPKRNSRRVQETPLKGVEGGEESTLGVSHETPEKRVIGGIQPTAGDRENLSSPRTQTGSPQKITPSKHRDAKSESEQLLSPKRETRSATKKMIVREGGDLDAGDRSSSSDSVVGSAEDTGLDTSKMGRGKGTPRKRKSLRTSLKTMFDGVAQENAPPIGQMTDSNPRKIVSGSGDREVLKGAENQCEKATDDHLSLKREPYTPNGKGNKRERSDDTTDLSSALGSPLKKRRRTSGDAKEKPRPTGLAPKNGTPPSPMRKVPAVLASPEMFQQWPRRKLRSTPSPNSHFLRGIARTARGASVSKTRKSPDTGRPLERSLRKRSKTCLKFPASDSNVIGGADSVERDEDATQEGGGIGGCKISGKENVVGGDEQMGESLDVKSTPKHSHDLGLLLLKKETPTEEIERHFSFHSDDDEIEFVKIDRSPSKDSLGGQVSAGRDDAESPVFSGNSSDMRSPDGLQSPFKSPRANLRRGGGPGGTNGSPVFNYVSTPHSSGIRMTFRRCPSSVSRADIVPSSVSPSEDASNGSSNPRPEETSSAASENDDVFPSLCEDRPKRQSSQATPPGSSRKVNCNLSTKGLYGLLHSPFAGSSRQRLGSRNKSVSVSHKDSRKDGGQKESL